MKTAFNSKVFANIFDLSRVTASTIGSEYKLDSQDFEGVKLLQENILPKE